MQPLNLPEFQLFHLFKLIIIFIVYAYCEAQVK